MSIFYSDDPVRDFERYDEEQNKWLESRPKCVHCHEHIQGELLMKVEGELYHTTCAVEVFSDWTEDYTE